MCALTCLETESNLAAAYGNSAFKVLYILRLKQASTFVCASVASRRITCSAFLLYAAALWLADFGFLLDLWSY